MPTVLRLADVTVSWLQTATIFSSLKPVPISAFPQSSAPLKDHFLTWFQLQTDSEGSGIYISSTGTVSLVVYRNISPATVSQYWKMSKAQKDRVLLSLFKRPPFLNISTVAWLPFSLSPSLKAPTSCLQQFFPVFPLDVSP